MSLDAPDLRQRFARALALAGATREGDELFDELAAHYREPARHYHTLEHVEACLRWLDTYAAHAVSPAEVALALWYHDAIYDPRASDNELKSAELARRRLGEVGLPGAAVERVAASILATQHHDADPGDARLVVDLDLTILGADPSRYDDFERRIQQEYAHVPDRAFRQGRREILARFLARSAIYDLLALRDRLEAGARDNLERRIAELSSFDDGR